ncbi:hypothetical protein EDB85DRAFT_2282053 [Lactarius pseudohatsudake]|nr:hypothetical protein EDB85DRAFT_2282053 [Lactarius pseudohatsudake]
MSRVPERKCRAIEYLSTCTSNSELEDQARQGVTRPPNQTSGAEVTVAAAAVGMKEDDDNWERGGGNMSGGSASGVRTLWVQGSVDVFVWIHSVNLGCILCVYVDMDVMNNLGDRQMTSRMTSLWTYSTQWMVKCHYGIILLRNPYRNLKHHEPDMRYLMRLMNEVVVVEISGENANSNGGTRQERDCAMTGPRSTGPHSIHQRNVMTLQYRHRIGGEEEEETTTRTGVAIFTLVGITLQKEGNVNLDIWECAREYDTLWRNGISGIQYKVDC